MPGNLCESAPARPFLYEGVFAHEYQHLLESYEDSDETSWVNEGLSDYAQTITGYVDPSVPITELGWDSHIQCFLGWTEVAGLFNVNPDTTAGPENSLTLWGDQGDDEILCDYGAAYSFMEFLAGRYGISFMSALHDEDANGLVGLHVLDARRTAERLRLRPPAQRSGRSPARVADHVDLVRRLADADPPSRRVDGRQRRPLLGLR